MIEYTHRLEFDVLTAPLAEIDRRALSQAWYSALHLASASAAPRATHVVRGTPAANASAGLPRASVRRRSSLVNQVVLRATRERPICEIAADRRSPRSDLARRIERVAARPLASARGASFALRGPYGRVQILLRAHGGRTHLVAVCSPEAREQVARALDQARYALARGGIAACAVRVREAAR